MILDARTFPEAPALPDAPVVIIGGGAVGLFLAVSLARSKVASIVIEAGGRVADTRRSGQSAVSLGKTHAGVTIGRAFGLGGTSTLWRGQLAEFDEVDLCAPGRAWPIGYAELQRWYQHVYRFLDLPPIEPDKILFDQSARLDAPQCGIEHFATFCMPQQNFATRFRSEIQSNPLLTVILNATVNDISFTGSKATAISVAIPDGRNIRIAGRDFVFACGTIEISRFFLSTQRRSEVPWKHNPCIGTYFQDHIVGNAGKAQIINESRFRDFFEVALKSGIKKQPKLRNSETFQRVPYSGAVGSFAFSSQMQESFDNIKLLVRTFGSGMAYSKLKTFPADLWTLGGVLYPLVARFIRDRRLMVFLDRGVDFVVQSEQIPIAESAIRLLNEEPDQDGLFRAAVHWKLDGGEISNILDFSRRVDKYLKEQNIASLEIDERLLDEDPSVLEQFNDFYHQAGGMCIGGSASSSVVDSDCRVWNTANVYVAGASVFPTSSHANVTLTALAMAARLASILEKPR